MRGAWTESSADLAPIVADAVTGGDVVLVKGSAGSRTGLVVEALSALDAQQQDKNDGTPQQAAVNGQRG